VRWRLQDDVLRTELQALRSQPRSKQADQRKAEIKRSLNI
jgi:hypothetical protein